MVTLWQALNLSLWVEELSYTRSILKGASEATVSLFTLDAPRAKFPVCEYVYYNSILFDKQLDIDILDTTKDLFILSQPLHTPI